MQDTFFTSKQAAEITSCTLRQLQYWREKEVIVPAISETGTGRSIYYSKYNLLELAIMRYLLSVGLNFDIASTTLKRLKCFEPDLLGEGKSKRYMLFGKNLVPTQPPVNTKQSTFELSLTEYDLEQAITYLDIGQPVIPLWLDVIFNSIFNHGSPFN